MALAGGLAETFRKKALENLSIIYRRAGDHERSLHVCLELMACPEFSMAGYEGAAIYYERIGHDLETALRIVEQAIARVESQRSRKLLKVRWDRLQHAHHGLFVNNSTT